MDKNVIQIDGKKSLIINPDLQQEIGLFLTAQYQSEQYPISKIYPLETPNGEPY